MHFNERETASVLVGLRMLQLAQDDEAIPQFFGEYFEDFTPLTDDEINALCEAICCDPMPTEDDCDCDNRSWHGDEHDSACPLAGQSRVTAQETTPIPGARSLDRGSGSEMGTFRRDAGRRKGSARFLDRQAQPLDRLLPGVREDGMSEQTILIIDFRGGITPKVENPPARYRATIAGEARWFKAGSDAVDYIEHQRNWASNLPTSIFDEWAEHTVSDADAICEFPRLSGPAPKEIK